MEFKKGDKIKVTNDSLKNAGPFMCNESIHLDTEKPYTFRSLDYNSDMIWIEEFGLPFKKDVFVKI